jgi:GTPase SAR1 family protein
LNDLDSFEQVEGYVREVLNLRGREIPMFLIGNKNDLERKVTFEDACSFALKFDMIFLEISTRTEDGIDFLMEIIARHLRSYEDLKSLKILEKN